MQIDQKAALSQIDFVLDKWKNARLRSKYDDCSDLGKVEKNEIITLLAATIERLAPLKSIYRENVHAILKKYGEDNAFNITILPGILSALRTDFETGHLQSIHELVHADIFGDFLEMAGYLLEEGYKDPAAVIAGGVIEEHLRKMCQKNDIEIMKVDRPKKADSLNSELAGDSIYSKLDQKSVTAWLDLRNKAAHGKYDEYTTEQVSLMVQGIRDFISRHPA